VFSQVNEQEVMARYDDKLIVGCPSELRAAIDAAASAKLMKLNEYVRRALVDRVEADGIAVVRRPAA
jgi:predicted HicB family RNase H-like nuclease